jgi:hypothetical protein
MNFASFRIVAWVFSSFFLPRTVNRTQSPYFDEAKRQLRTITAVVFSFLSLRREECTHSYQ